MSSQRLRDEISMLGAMLGRVVRQVHGQEALTLIEGMRTLSRDARGGDERATEKLQGTIGTLTFEQMRIVVRGFSVFLDLANLAEDRERIRVLQDRAREAAPEPRQETIRHTIQGLKQAGKTANSIQAMLGQLQIELVLTAHPTEAKRRSLRSKLRTMRQLLYLFDEDLSSPERQKIEVRLQSELLKLWQTDFMRPWRPSVLQEVQRGLAIAPNLWEVVPRLFDDLRESLAESFPQESFSVKPFIRYGSWIGGDRDGHPYVTAEVTSQTLTWLRETALDFHLQACRDLAESLSMSQQQTSVTDELVQAVEQAQSDWPDLANTLATVPPNEVYRRFLHVIHWRLRQTQKMALNDPVIEGAYSAAGQLREDVERIAGSLQNASISIISETEVMPWCDRIATFGFYFARLDVRQDSGVYQKVLGELLREAGVTTNFDEFDEEQRQEMLLQTLGKVAIEDEMPLSEEARETLDLFRLLRRTARCFGMEALGGHVLSMTRTPSDLLTILWLWHWSQGVDGGHPEDATLRLPIIPLYETVDDLALADKTTDRLLSLPIYREYVEDLGDQQIVMIGYSDSTKDGGYLAACWALHEAQRKVFAVTQRQGVDVTFFHGRGGSLGRGGGPAARGIRSLPTGTFQGGLRLTEQGEVLAERYDDPRIAQRHLEQLVCATLESALLSERSIFSEWTSLMDSLAQRSRIAYRDLIDHEGFVDFFRQATPIAEIERLPIGSRPSRRKVGAGLKGLRAIPWVFSWTQVRGMIPAWYGVGTAVNDLIEESAPTLKLLQAMYREWDFMQAWVDNAALALSKTDLSIFNRYAELPQNRNLLEAVGAEISEEFSRTRAALGAITEQREFAGSVPWLAESIRVRNRYIDPLNLIQIELLERSQNVPADSEAGETVRHLLQLSIKGIAAGMRTTG